MGKCPNRYWLKAKGQAPKSKAGSVLREFDIWLIWRLVSAQNATTSNIEQPTPKIQSRRATIERRTLNNER